MNNIASWLSFFKSHLYLAFTKPNCCLMMRNGCSTLARILAFIYSILMAALFWRGCCLKGFTLPGHSAINQSTSTGQLFALWRSLVAGIG